MRRRSGRRPMTRSLDTASIVEINGAAEMLTSSRRRPIRHGALVDDGFDEQERHNDGFGDVFSEMRGADRTVRRQRLCGAIVIIAGPKENRDATFVTAPCRTSTSIQWGGSFFVRQAQARSDARYSGLKLYGADSNVSTGFGRLRIGALRPDSISARRRSEVRGGICQT